MFVSEFVARPSIKNIIIINPIKLNKMKTSKNISLRIAVTLQFSTSCFSQDSPIVNSNVKLITLVNPISILRISRFETKSVENISKVDTCTENGLSVNSLSNYSGPEMIKLAKYIKTLENKKSANYSTILDAIATASINDNNAKNTKLSDNNITEFLNIADFLNQFCDSDIIKLANYIKNLENTNSSSETTGLQRLNQSIASNEEIETFSEFLRRQARKMK